MILTLNCAPCGRSRPHRLADSFATCETCRTVRQVEGDLIPVVDMRDCRWCNERKPADHVCPAGAVGCTERPPEKTPCGGCGCCIAAMTADLRRREHPFAAGPYGSPSDLDTP